MMSQKIWSIEKFLELYNVPRTIRSYRGVIQSLIKSVNPALEEATNEEIDAFSIVYIEGLKKEEYDLEDDLLEFRKEGGFGGGKSPATKLGYIKKWLEVNNIVISSPVRKSITREAIEGEDKVPSREELARIIDHLDLGYKALTLVLASSGVRVSEALAFKMKDVDFTHKPIKIKTTKRSNKVKGRAEYVFITDEAGCALRSWMDRRDVLMTQMRAKAGQTFDPSDERIFPFAHTTYLGAFNTARVKARLNEVNELGRSLVNIHSLRDYFATNFSSEEVADFFMGHKRGTISVYRKLKERPDYVLQEYLKSVPALTISNEWRSKLEADVKAGELERDKTALEIELDKKSARQLSVIGDLQKELEANKVQTNEIALQVAQYMGTQQAIQDQLRKDYETALAMIKKVGDKMIIEGDRPLNLLEVLPEIPEEEKKESFGDHDPDPQG